MSESDALLRVKLNAETGRLVWRELERHFARGVVILVAPGLDLVEVALQISRDNKDQVAAWLQAGQVRRADSEDARSWHQDRSRFWAVVVAPWVLVQEIRE